MNFLKFAECSIDSTVWSLPAVYEGVSSSSEPSSGVYAGGGGSSLGLLSHSGDKTGAEHG